MDSASSPPPTVTPLAMFARVDLLRLRSLWLVARRDAAFLVAASIGSVGFVGLVWRAAVLAQAHPAASLPGAALAGGLLFHSLCPRAGSRNLATLNEGPFHPWARDWRLLRRWLMLRTAVLCAVVVSLAVVVLTFVATAQAVALSAALVVGLVLGAFIYSWSGAPSAAPMRQTPLEPARSASKRRGLARPGFIPAPTWLMGAVSLRRRAGWLPAWAAVPCIAAAAAFVGGLTARNNGEPTIGLGVISGAMTLAGCILLQPDLAVVRLLARQGAAPSVIILSALAGPVALTLPATLAAGLAARLPLAPVLLASLCAGLALSAYVKLLILNGMYRSASAARRVALVDLGLCALLATVIGPLALAHLLARVVMLYRAALRLRWRDD